MRCERPPVDYLSLFLNRVQRHHLTNGIHNERIIYTANPFYFPAKDPWAGY